MGAKVGGYALAPETNRPFPFELVKLEDKIARSQIETDARSKSDNKL